MADKPFGCISEGIQVAGNPSSLYNINLVTGDLTLRGEITPSGVYNAIGYNIIDGNIYGYSNGSIVLINNDQTIDVLPPIPNLPIAGYFVGDIDLNGWYYLYSLSEGAIIYVVDLNPNSPNYLQLIDPATGNVQTTAPYGILTEPTNFADWTFNPIDGQLYAALTNTGTIIRVNPITGVQTQLNTTGLPSSGQYGAAFSDANGAVYVINNTTGSVYRAIISGNNATASLFSQAQSASQNDGARCPLSTVDALSIRKSVDLSEATLNSILTYTITISNNSLATLTGVTVTDVVPEGTTFVEGSMTLDGNPIAGDPNVGVNIGNILGNQTLILQFQVLVGNSIPQQNPISNVAIVTFDTGSPVESEPVETLITEALVVDKFVDLSQAPLNSMLTYTINITNLANVALTDITIVDIVPQGTTFIGGSLTLDGNPIAGDPNMGITISVLNPNQTVVLQFKVLVGESVPQQNPIVNIASAVYSDGTPVESEPIETIIIDTPVITKAADLDEVDLNSILTYTITIKNTAIIELTNVVVKDVIPEGVTFVEDSVTLNGNPIAGDITMGINIGTLAVDSVAIITFQVLANDTIPDINPIVNTATVSFNDGIPTESNSVETFVVSNARCQAITDIITSVALEQTALSHILNAEGEKIQKVLEFDIPIEKTLEVNESVKTLVNSISNLEFILQGKLSLFKEYLCDEC